jgi:hypothetical protein
MKIMDWHFPNRVWVQKTDSRWYTREIKSHDMKRRIQMVADLRKLPYSVVKEQVTR